MLFRLAFVSHRSFQFMDILDTVRRLLNFRIAMADFKTMNVKPVQLGKRSVVYLGLTQNAMC